MKKINAARAARYEENREVNLRYIYAKLPYAEPSELALIAAFIRGMGVCGWHSGEHDRQLPQKETDQEVNA
jgi:hypothetical protein